MKGRIETKKEREERYRETGSRKGTFISFFRKPKTKKKKTHVDNYMKDYF